MFQVSRFEHLSRWAWGMPCPATVALLHSPLLQPTQDLPTHRSTIAGFDTPQKCVTCASASSQHCSQTFYSGAFHSIQVCIWEKTLDSFLSALPYPFFSLCPNISLKRTIAVNPDKHCWKPWPASMQKPPQCIKMIFNMDFQY